MWYWPTVTHNLVDPELFEDIQTMESFGSYGSKIQALVRHLLFLQATEPGAKSIVFSAWADSLHSGSQFPILIYASSSNFIGNNSHRACTSEQ
jgi:hypothetical protein